jgi:hypothetical protein
MNRLTRYTAAKTLDELLDEMRMINSMPKENEEMPDEDEDQGMTMM